MKGLNEINQVIILAAGRSRRMENLSKQEPKCLLPYKGERVLQRLVRQLKKNRISKIVITTGYRADIMRQLFENDEAVTLVENQFYEEDVNIYSVKLALSQIDDGPFVIFEADTILEDSLVKFIVGQDFEGKSVWFTRGAFNPSQYGGILRSDKYGKITDIRMVSAYQDKFKRYSKLTGVMRVGPNEAELFRAFINKYAATTVKQYFYNVWIENLRLLPCEEADVSMFEFYTFNTPEEYSQTQKNDIGMKQITPEITLVPTSKLHHIESFDSDRVSILVNEIESVGEWRVPLVVDKNGFLIMDGQHRFEAAKMLRLHRVPCIMTSYEDVQVWSLRKEISVTSKKVRKYVKDGKIYPYKTVKHRFDFEIPEDLEYKLDDLR